MSFMSQLALIKEMLESSESSVRSAKQLLNEMMGGQAGKADYTKMAQKLPDMEMGGDNGKTKIVEGVFDGQNMVGKDKNIYPVPANYASKSKLIPGDILKLTINEQGGFLYKQIAPIERQSVLGILTTENGKYKVIAGGKVYNVLLASVTYFKGEAGDQVSLVIPVEGDCEWGAIEAIIPQTQVCSFPPEKEEVEEEEKTEKKKKTTRKKKEEKEEDMLSDLDV